MDGLKKNLQRVLIAGIIQALAGALNAFIVPKFIGVEQFGYYREFLLYSGYIGFLHFGFVDGMMVKYAGKPIESLDKREVESEFAFLVYFQFVIAACFVIIGILLSNISIFLFGLSVFINNVYLHLSFIFLTTGQLKYYAFVRILPVFFLIFNGILILSGISDYRYYIAAYVLANIVLLLYFFIVFKKYFNIRPYSKFKFSGIKLNFSSGMIVMLGNFLSIFFFSLDRWGVYFYFNNTNFAFYTFALSLMQIIQVLVTSISITFYPYLAKEENRESILKYTKFLLILSTFSLILYFALSEIVSQFVSKFIPSLILLKYLFLSAPALIVSNSVVINLLKKKERIKTYFFHFLVFLIFGIILNYAIIVVFKTMISIALINVVLYYIFLIYTTQNVNITKLETKDLTYLIFSLVIFYLAAEYLNYFTGIIVFTVFALGLTYLFYRNILNQVFLNINEIYRKMLRKN